MIRTDNQEGRDVNLLKGVVFDDDTASDDDDDDDQREQEIEGMPFIKLTRCVVTVLFKVRYWRL